MELGVQVVGDYDHLLHIARISEDGGAAALALADHYLYGQSHDDYAAPAYDSLVQAAALARDTERMELVMLVSPVTFRHPAVYAKTALTVDDASGGRFTLGLGTGWHDDEHGYHGIDYPPMGERFEMLEEQLAWVKAYFDHPEEGYEGSRYRFTGYDAHPRARTEGRRLMVGGSGAVKTPTLAGRYCEEFNLYLHDAEGIEARLGVMRAAAEEAGRDPAGILISTCVPLIGGDSEDELLEHATAIASRRPGADPAEALERWREHSGIRVGSWEEHRDFLGTLADNGMERAYLQLAASSPAHLELALAELG
ncbi:MAG: LLM class flavin-dependent oxidoreductase [Acidimicrobiia bacterium]|nr:LLM class flavin-dependent oxidoreductase [Acidimicrobiia bacterium]